MVWILTFSSSFSEIVTFCPQFLASLRPEEQKYGGNQTPSVTIYIFGVSKNIFFFTWCPKNCLNFDFFFLIFFEEKRSKFRPFLGHPVMKKIFFDTPKMYIVTLGAWFPPYFCSSGLSDAQYWGQKVTISENEEEKVKI